MILIYSKEDNKLIIQDWYNYENDINMLIEKHLQKKSILESTHLIIEKGKINLTSL